MFIFVIRVVLVLLLIPSVIISIDTFNRYK
jgi:hypothetical protein